LVARYLRVVAIERLLLPFDPAGSALERFVCAAEPFALLARKAAVPGKLVEPALAFVDRVLARGRDGIALVGHAIALVGDPVALVGGVLALVGGPVALVGERLPAHQLAVTALGRVRPVRSGGGVPLVVRVAALERDRALVDRLRVAVPLSGAAVSFRRAAVCLARQSLVKLRPRSRLLDARTRLLRQPLGSFRPFAVLVGAGLLHEKEATPAGSFRHDERLWRGLLHPRAQPLHLRGASSP
jgi:hypothetical protein